MPGYSRTLVFKYSNNYRWDMIYRQNPFNKRYKNSKLISQNQISPNLRDDFIKIVNLHILTSFQMINIEKIQVLFFINQWQPFFYFLDAIRKRINVLQFWVAFSGFIGVRFINRSASRCRFLFKFKICKFKFQMKFGQCRLVNVSINIHIRDEQVIIQNNMSQIKIIIFKKMFQYLKIRISILYGTIYIYKRSYEHFVIVESINKIWNQITSRMITKQRMTLTKNLIDLIIILRLT
ncbi:unnamed protein product (macronuclear) [Paramecium tetraurelia]|uniref:Transmembrane protein n=1 Tax=Paramecium tetraurelia TaxID=5888 RepID=A0CMK5_PARTE|nr:uncharacterized protein GSPATT00008501001 [Paramecium tetraurelia]CAK72022.1 unnamed protein product [Paramecium tetraurelia]|eukprot:XP_001439419.1 hypothetical protein (macronuclear) [Paramecium tetraurelia strain d4-2]